ncbi:DUF2271 domain-containing protein [Bizionia argentinensis JUB59]|uniref:DUF2271 domain-containing protein n=1 Tax=Bizionia argentinensis JUB59 TaxID=1046627 RepID=G2EF67_9FLAO|nr:DUF2271 domain-containing protein [Bizionia argentinensis]EGV42918.2 DUF2271 domain-containing protein [Bizionia argentinensis JUB59]
MKIKQILLVSFITLGLLSFTTIAESTKYKCMIQMTNYTGEAAYVVISLINPDGEYEKTLYVQGDDSEWYHDVTDWWKFYGKKRNNLDAITGATVAGGSRTINVIDIDDSKIDAGYSIRFETAVEDQEYYTKDVEFPLTSENVKSKKEGSGFIRYVRMMPN